MRNQMKRTIAKVLTMSLTLSLMATAADVDAAKKMKLSKKSITLSVGKSSTITIQNVKAKKIKKLTVKSTKKKIVAVKKTGDKKTKFKVTGKAKGSAKVQVTLRLKEQKKAQKLSLKVKVTQRTTVPNVQPTAEAIANTMPSAVPSVKPSATPTAEPSATVGVVATPTVMPSETIVPEVTVSPTAVPEESTTPEIPAETPVAPETPTEEPTETPMVTAMPTIAPTEEPVATAPASETAEPVAPSLPIETPMVSMVPTAEPTVAPTEMPVATPEITATPVATPTAIPEDAVSNTVQIENVIMRENRTLLITVNESCTLTTNNLVVKTKNTKEGTYGDPLVIDSIEKKDQFQYKVVLKSTTGNYVVNNGYAQVSIAKKNGTTLVAEDQYEREYETVTREWIYRFTLGGSTYNSFMNLYNEDFVGALQYEVTGEMPSGMSYWLSGKNLYLRGKPEVIGTYKWKVSLTDEVGNELVYNCTCIVGDADHLVATAYSDAKLAGNKLTAYVKAVGGSDSYTYTKVDGDYDFTVASDGEVTAKFAQAGTYKVYVDVADAANANLKTRVEVVFVVKDAYTICGKVTDLGGSNIEFQGGELSVYMRPQDPQIYEDYFSTQPRASMESSDSSFSINVPAGIYDVYFEYRNGSTVFKVIKGVEVTDKNVDLGTVQLPACQVTLKAPNGDNLYMVYWRDENDVLIARNATFLVRPGTYTLHSDPDISPIMASLYDFTVTFTATNKSLEKEVTATPTGDNITAMQLGKDLAVSLDSSTRKLYKFSPEETGTYRFYTSDLTEDLFFDVYSDSQYGNTNWRYLTMTYTFQTCQGGNQVDRSATLQKGTTYYIELDLIWDNKEDEFTFGVEKVE